MEPPPPLEQPPRPRSHTVTTTSSSFTANLSASSSTLAYDREFLRTPPGLLMVAEIVSAVGWSCTSLASFRDNWDNRVKAYDTCVTLWSANIGPAAEGRGPWTTLGLCLNSQLLIPVIVTRYKECHGYSTFFAFVVTSCYAGNTYFSFISWRSRTLQ
uniref:Uncharacterized protein n=1 Tax=Pavo cristatus TaxID=9049 RepID=A0A8C9L245_PAVCR